MATRKRSTAAARKPRRRRVRPKVRAVLKVIDTLLAKGGQDAMDLWAVLTALRGPDGHGDILLKFRTTCVIRTAAFPKTETAPRSLPAQFANPLNTFAVPETDNAHFNTHVLKAADALGLLEGRG